jgi:hypothetical protein
MSDKEAVGYAVAEANLLQHVWTALADSGEFRELTPASISLSDQYPNTKITIVWRYLNIATGKTENSETTEVMIWDRITYAGEGTPWRSLGEDLLEWMYLRSIGD